MSLRKPANPEEIQKEFQEALNEEGFGFHYAVLGLMQDLVEQRKSWWRLVRAEFPVMVNGSATRIDFVLRRADQYGRSDLPLFYMLAECKRANPAYSDWCFVQAPFTRANPTDGYVFQDRAQRIDDETVVVLATKQYFGSS